MIINLKQSLVKHILAKYEKINLKSTDFEFFPDGRKVYDLSTNLLLVLARKLHISLDATSEIEIYLRKFLDVYKFEKNSKNPSFSKVNFENNGYINFKYRNEKLISLLLNYKDTNFRFDYTSAEINQTKINYEYVSANPTGFLHIGHLRNAIVGDITARILEFVGHEVTLEYWLNDYGNQINDMANSVLFYFNKLAKLDNSISELSIPYKNLEIKDYAKILFDNNLAELLKKSKDDLFSYIKEKGMNYFENEIKEVLHRHLRLKPYDFWTSERKIYTNINPNLIENLYVELDRLNATYLKDGAKWIKTSEHGDEKDRVLVKKDGTTTYMVADIIGHIQKFKRFNKKQEQLWGVDTKRNETYIIDLWGSDHHGYEDRIRASIDILGYNPNNYEVNFISMVKIVDGGNILKMSKRAGTSLRIIDVINLLGKDNDEVIDILRYFIVSKNKEQNLALDIRDLKSISRENRYHYCQYSHVRLNSIIKKFEDKFNTNFENLLIKMENHEYKHLGINSIERELINKMIEFRDVIKGASIKREPSILIKYLESTSKIFNSYYNKVSVLNNTDKEITEERIVLIYCLRNLYRTIFGLLGINPKDKM